MEAACSQKSWHTYQSAQCPAQKTVIFILIQEPQNSLDGQMVGLSHENRKNPINPSIDNVRKWQLKGN
jgi:hypothetical protein